MVDFIREQTRQYASDQSGAIRQEQLANNVKEWNSVIQGAGSIAQSVEKQRQKELKLQEEADQKIIDTQIGQQADIATQKIIQDEINKGTLNPNTPAGRSRIEEIAKEQHDQFAGLGTTESFKTKLETMQRRSADEGLKRAYTAFDSKQKKKAEESLNYIDLYNSQMAEEAGKNGDFDKYMSFTEKTTDPIVDYVVAHSANKDKQKAANDWRVRQGTSYLIGMAQTNPVEAARIIGIQDKQAVEDLLKEENPKMSKKEIKRLTDSIMQSEQQASDEKLEKIFGEKVLNSYGEDEVNARENLRADLQKALGRMVRKGIAQKELNAKQENYSYVANTYSNVLNPNPVISADASLSLENGVEQFSPDFINEAPKIKESLKVYQDNSEKVKEEQFPTTEGTISSIKQIQAFALSDKQKPAEKIELALNTMNAIHEEPVTQGQYEEANNIIYNALSEPENNKQLENTMALLSATILDNYAELFPDFEEMAELEKKTDKEFREYSSLGVQSGIEKEYSWEDGSKQKTLTYPELPKGLKAKAKSFDYNKADEKSKAKYNLLRDTYGAVQTDMSVGDFEGANKKLFALPYNIAKINYGGRLSPAMIDQFMEIDLDGKQSVYPQFSYNGYTFQYMGIDKTGIILAKRIL